MNEPGALVLGIFAQLIDRVKQMIPLDSHSNPISTMVYSQLVLGMPVTFKDYGNPWTPQTATPSGAPPQDPEALGEAQARALMAAWKTSVLAKTMLEVTTDGRYKQYPIGRHLDLAYGGVLNAMTPRTSADLPAQLKHDLEAAERVLYKFDADGQPIYNRRTSKYEAYRSNASALAQAKADYGAAYEEAKRAGALSSFPIKAAPLKVKIEQAYSDLRTQGAEDVERALHRVNTIGRPIELWMIDKAKQAFDENHVALGGVMPGMIPLSRVLPSNWCDPSDPEGFQILEVNQSQYQHTDSAHFSSQAASHWESHASSASAGGGAILGFVAFGGDHSEQTQSGSFEDSSQMRFGSVFHNTAKNLRIRLEYALCTFVRPWLTSDVFYLKNWRMATDDKYSVSAGTIDGNIATQNRLLPMIPQQFLVVRNVEISSQDWGSDGAVMSEFYAAQSGDTTSHSEQTAGMAGVSLGFISFGGRAASASADASGNARSRSAASSGAYYQTTFDGSTLRIPGAQIVAFLSDIVPACPEFDHNE